MYWDNSYPYYFLPFFGDSGGRVEATQEPRATAAADTESTGRIEGQPATNCHQLKTSNTRTNEPITNCNRLKINLRGEREGQMNEWTNNHPIELRGSVDRETAEDALRLLNWFFDERPDHYLIQKWRTVCDSDGNTRMTFRYQIKSKAESEIALVSEY